MTDIWEDSFDTPCVECGSAPCYIMWGGDALCDGCFREIIDAGDYDVTKTVKKEDIFPGSVLAVCGKPLVLSTRLSEGIWSACWKDEPHVTFQVDEEELEHLPQREIRE